MSDTRDELLALREQWLLSQPAPSPDAATGFQPSQPLLEMQRLLAELEYKRAVLRQKGLWQ